MSSAIPPIILLTRVDSTNNYAMAQVHAGLATHGMAWFANEQYAGKGQRGRQWETIPGENIAMSIALQPTFTEPTNQFQLSAAIALAVYDFFSKYAGDETKIKWPNDIYWRDRKAGGILIENIIGRNDDRWPMTDDRKESINTFSSNHQRPTTNGQRNSSRHPATVFKWAIAGIGININQTDFHSSLPNPVSLKQITGKEWDTFELAVELQRCVLGRFEQLKEEGFLLLYQNYLSHQYKINQPQKFKKDNRVFEAVIKNINPQGQLVLQHATDESYDFGEVEWVIEKNKNL